MSLFCWPPSIDIFNILPSFLRQPLLRRLRMLIPTHAKLQLYKAAILPHLTYCSTIWHLCTASDKRKVKDYRREPLTHSVPVRPHAPGNKTPLKFHCAFRCPSRLDLIWLAVAKKQTPLGIIMGRNVTSMKLPFIGDQTQPFTLCRLCLTNVLKLGSFLYHGFS